MFIKCSLEQRFRVCNLGLAFTIYSSFRRLMQDNWCLRVLPHDFVQGSRIRRFGKLVSFFKRKKKSCFRMKTHPPCLDDDAVGYHMEFCQATLYNFKRDGWRDTFISSVTIQQQNKVQCLLRDIILSSMINKTFCSLQNVLDEKLMQDNPISKDKYIFTEEGLPSGVSPFTMYDGPLVYLKMKARGPHLYCEQ